MQGNWTATLSSAVLGESAVDIFIKQTGKTLSSDRLYFGNTACSLTGTMSGTVDGITVRLTLQEDGIPDKVMVASALSNGVLTGNYWTSGSCTNGDGGAFSARPIPAVTSSSWSGTTMSGSMNTNFIATFNEASSTVDLTGSITFPSSPCLGTVDVTGLHVGSLIVVMDKVTLRAAGSISTNGKTIQGDYETGDVCGNEIGTFTLSRP